MGPPGNRGSWGPCVQTRNQGRTDNLWDPPGNRGSWGPCVLAQTQKSL
ncbi:unnamed protein product [Staurois parvus]|uniref:Uncharacterized protein n=1 Tax=Staurois parvus TaxID=386267 RepID=A0ABN9BTT8_9NEOB|nr:unnamed protein product [Staurois parvus]